MTCCLYRHYDVDKVLLYVGISMDAAKRTAKHSRSSDWFKRVRVITLEHFESRAEAERAEVAAIVKEKPAFNIIHSESKTLRLLKKALKERGLTLDDVQFDDFNVRKSSSFQHAMPRPSRAVGYGRRTAGRLW